MLFRTVYGPELQAVYTFVTRRGVATTESLQRWFVQEQVTTTEGANLGEAMAFLLALKLLHRDHEQPETLFATPVPEFRLGVLERLNEVHEQPNEHTHELDPWFSGILRQCFVKPNHLYVQDLHRVVNAEKLPVPCSEEKVTAWRRVMEYLGCGRRMGPGFLATYRVELVKAILRRWAREGPLEDFLRFAERYIPTLTSTGDISEAISNPLLHLEALGHLKLSTRGDFAGRAYLGERRLKWISMGG